MDSRDSIEPSLPAYLAPIRPASLVRPAPAQAPGGQGEGYRALGLRILWTGLIRYWRLVLPLWVLASALALWAVHTYVHPSYQATSLVKIDAGLELFGSLHGGSNNVNGSYLTTQVNLFTSVAVLDAALKNAEVRDLQMIRSAEDPIDELRKNLVINIRPGTSLVDVSIKSKSPEEGKTIVNAVVDAFIEFQGDAHSKTNDRIFQDLKKAKEKLEEDIKTKERELFALVDAAQGTVTPGLIGVGNAAKGGGDPKEKEDPAITLTAQEYRGLQVQKINAELELHEAEAQLERQREQYEARVGGAGGDDAIAESRRQELHLDAQLAQDPEVKEAHKEYLAAAQKVANAMRIIRKGNDPSTVAAKKLLAEKQGRYEDIRSAKIAALRRTSHAVPDDVRQAGQALDECEKRVESARTKLRICEETLNRMNLDVQKGASSTIRIKLAEQSLDVVRDMVKTLDSRIQQVKFEEGSDRRVVTIDRAVAAQVNDRRIRYMAGAPVGVLGLLLVGVMLLEVRSGRVTHPDDLTGRLRAEIYSVPPLPTARVADESRRLEQLEEFSQRMDHIRVALCGPAAPGAGRCVMITSAIGGEGKTTLAAQLAGRCANAGLSTLLIDADLRRPMLARLLEVPEEPGLTEILAGTVGPEETLVPIGNAGGFHLLPAGGSGPDPGRLFSGNAFGPLLQRLRQAFDVVIIDTSPVLPVPDALQLGRWADGAVIAARHDSSRSKLVERANKLLQSANIPLLGVVVNGVRGGGSAYGAYYGSYRGVQAYRANAPAASAES